MRPLLIVIALVALVLLVIGIAVETLKFLLYVGLVVLIASAALVAVQRLRSSGIPSLLSPRSQLPQCAGIAAISGLHC